MKAQKSKKSFGRQRAYNDERRIQPSTHRATDRENDSRHRKSKENANNIVMGSEWVAGD